MRTEKEIYDLVLNFAFQDERIRIVTLEGSRTNVNIPKDNLQDYDITFFVIDMGEFLKSDDWLSVFGNRIMMQKPEDMELFPPEEKGFSYIMLFDDGVKIDFADKWVHLRKSNTEPIIRVYAEAKTPELAEETAAEVMAVIEEMAKK